MPKAEDAEATLRGGAAPAPPAAQPKAYGACSESASAPAEEEEDEEVPGCCSQGWPALWTVVLLDTLAGIVMSMVFPDLGAAYFGGGEDPCAGEGGGSAACDAAVSRFTSVDAAFGFASSVLMFACGPLAGAAADAVGTKPVLVLSMLVKIVQALALMGVSWAGLSIYYLFGSFELASLVPTKLTFGLWVLEHTPPAGRSQVYARLTAVATLDKLIVPLASSFLNQRTAAVFSMACTLAALGSSILGLTARPGKGAPRGVLPGAEQSLVARFDMRGVRKLFTDPSTNLIMMVIVVDGIVADGSISVWFYYLKERFGMNMNTVGPIITVITLSNLVCQFFLVGPLEKLLGFRGCLRLTFLSGSCAAIAYILAPSMKYLWFIGFLDGFSALSNPILSAFLANLVTKRGAGGDIGVSLGIAQSATSVTSIIGPFIFKLVFSQSIQSGRHFPGAIWVMALALELLAMALTLRLPKDVDARH